MAERSATERSVSFASIARLVIVWHTHSYTRTVLTRRRQSKANSTNSHANDNNNNNKTNNSSNNNKPGNQNSNFECWLGRLYQNWSGAAAAAAGYDSILNRVSHGHKADTDTQVCTQITKTTLATAATTKTTTAVDAGNGLHKGGVWASSACALLQLTFWLQRVNDIPFFCCCLLCCCGRARFFDCHYVGHGSKGSRQQWWLFVFVLEFIAEFMSGLFYKCCIN